MCCHLKVICHIELKTSYFVVYLLVNLLSFPIHACVLVLIPKLESLRAEPIYLSISLLGPILWQGRYGMPHIIYRMNNCMNENESIYKPQLSDFCL